MTDDIKRAFAEAASGEIELNNAQVKYVPFANGPAGMRLAFTGWHADGTPFAFVSAAFAGDPHQRARQIAEDLITAHTGRRPPQMSRRASGLARLMTTIKTIDTEADALATDLETASTRVRTEMAVTRQIVGTVNQAADELQAINAEYSNGSPPLDDSAAPQG